MTNNSKTYSVSEFMQQANDPNYLNIISQEYCSVIDLPIYGTCVSYQKIKNKKRNGKFPCWDETRVVLHKTYDGSDYIDANYVSGYDSNKKFIATQEPLVNTYNDFWHMIWQENCRLIVMLNSVENETKLEYIQYIASNQTDTIKEFAIKVESVELNQDYTERILNVTHLETKKVREIRHFTFLNWSESKEPEINMFIDFLVAVNKCYQKIFHDFIISETLVENTFLPGPIVVHCDSGVGRTLSLIAADACIYKLISTSSISVAKEVFKIRQQRNGVISLEQYKFIYDVLFNFLFSSDKYDWFLDLHSHFTDKDANILLNHVKFNN